jgi:hypothetical protein
MRRNDSKSFWSFQGKLFPVYMAVLGAVLGVCRAPRGHIPAGARLTRTRSGVLVRFSLCAFLSALVTLAVIRFFRAS